MQKEPDDVIGEKTIERVVRDVPQHWVGDGFPVRSLFSYQDGERFDPFLLLDYAGPHAFAPDTAPRGVGEHPHRGFETVTVVYQGEVAHRDSSGSRGTIGPGDVQWMTAASGVVHEEFHSERFTRDGGTLEMIQLWVNLPAQDKKSPPRYQAILDRDIPRVPIPGDAGHLRVIAGEAFGAKGTARTFTPVDLWDVELAANSQARLPGRDGHTTILCVRDGDVALGSSGPVAGGSLVLLSREGTEVTLRTRQGARFLFLGGQPIGEPIVGRGPFVMNRPEEIQQAMADYQSGRMGRLD